MSSRLRMPPPTVTRHEADLGRPADDVQDDPAPLVAGRDVEEDQLVGPFLLVARGDLDRVARVAEVDEVRPLHHAAFVDVEAGDDPLGQHCAVPVRSVRSAAATRSAAGVRSTEPGRHSGSTSAAIDPRRVDPRAVAPSPCGIARLSACDAGRRPPGSASSSSTSMILGQSGSELEEGPAVGLGQDPRVEDHDDPPVGLRPDQPAEPLLELDDRLGHLVLDERVAPARADRPRAGPPAAGGSGR